VCCPVGCNCDPLGDGCNAGFYGLIERIAAGDIDCASLGLPAYDL
jgi:hypothetical protein